MNDETFEPCTCLYPLSGLPSELCVLRGEHLEDADRELMESSSWDFDHMDQRALMADQYERDLEDFDLDSEERELEDFDFDEDRELEDFDFDEDRELEDEDGGERDLLDQTETSTATESCSTMATEGITAVARTAVARTGAADPIIDALSTVEDLTMLATIMAGDSTNYFCVLCTPTCRATLWC